MFAKFLIHSTVIQLLQELGFVVVTSHIRTRFFLRRILQSRNAYCVFQLLFRFFRFNCLKKKRHTRLTRTMPCSCLSGAQRLSTLSQIQQSNNNYEQIDYVTAKLSNFVVLGDSLSYWENDSSLLDGRKANSFGGS